MKILFSGTPADIRARLKAHDCPLSDHSAALEVIKTSNQIEAKFSALSSKDIDDDKKKALTTELAELGIQKKCAQRMTNVVSTVRETVVDMVSMQPYDSTVTVEGTVDVNENGIVSIALGCKAEAKDYDGAIARANESQRIEQERLKAESDRLEREARAAEEKKQAELDESRRKDAERIEQERLAKEAEDKRLADEAAAKSAQENPTPMSPETPLPVDQSASPSPADPNAVPSGT